MRTISAPLRDLLLAGSYVYTDIWTVTLSGGAVIRWTSHDQDVPYLGNTFAKGPLIERSTISEKVGLETATLDLTVTATSEMDLINGTPLIPFIRSRGLDGALVKLERAYAADWSSPVTIVGTVLRFSGKVTSIGSIRGGKAAIKVSSWTILLNASVPRNVFQTGCLRTLYDVNCGINPNSYRAAGTVSGGTALSFGSNVTGSAGFYSQGRIVFTSGGNNGVSRTVKVHAADGTISLIQPLPVTPSAGDTFYVYAGCDLSQATCGSKFNNLGRFKGTPYVPLPTAALGSAAPTTTKSGKF